MKVLSILFDLSRFGAVASLTQLCFRFLPSGHCILNAVKCQHVIACMKPLSVVC